MRVSLILLIAAASLATTAQAQQVASITGTVLDQETGSALPGCNLVIEGTNLGTASDLEGKFRLQQVPFGKVHLLASYIGYARQRQEIVVDRPELNLIVRLSPEPVKAMMVTVLATRARERETPVTFSMLNEDDIEQHYFAQDVPVLLSELPSTTFYSESGNGIGYNYLSIRGFDQRRISVTINGVPQNDPEDHNVYWLDFPDFLGNVEDIQVQRGAGSAFYGPPAIGGSVNIITSNFSRDRSITFSGGAGTYNTSKYSLGLNSGLLANKYVLFGRISRIQSDGYRDQSWADFKSYFVGAARFDKNLTSRLHVYGGPIEDHLAFSGISKAEAQNRSTRKTNPIARPDEIENFNQPHFELLQEYRLNDRLRLNSTAFYIRGYGFFDYDGSWAPMSYFRLTPEFGFEVGGDPENTNVDSLLIRAYVDNDQYGWLPQITWIHDRGELVLGSELRIHRSLHWGRIQKGDSDLPAAVAGEYNGLNYVGSRRYYEYRGAKDVASPYVHATYLLQPNVNLMFDLQLAYLRYRLYDEKFIGTEFEIPYTFLNPRVGINYNLSDNFNTFVNFSRTSREPRLKEYYDAAEATTPPSWNIFVVPQFELNPDGTYDFDEPLVKPEKLNDFELGLGYRDHDWQAAANLFYMDFRDEIVKEGKLDRFGQPVTGNAPRTLHTGIELIAQGRITSFLSLSANLMLSQNELKEYISPTDSVSLNGNPISGFPNALANARLTFSRSGFSASLAMQHVGKQYADNFKTDSTLVAPYTVFHGSLGYRFNAASIFSSILLQLHVQNIFDRLYISHGEGDDFFPAAERQVFLNAKYDLGF